MLLIYMDLINRRKKIKKHIFKLVIGAVVLSLIVAFAPFNVYKACRIGDSDHPLYCGYCYNGEEFSFGLLLYIIPMALGLVLSLLLIITYKQLIRK